MFKVFGCALLLLLSGFSFAEEKQYTRGEFHFSVRPVPGFVERSKLAEQWPAKAPGANDARWRNWLLDSQLDYRNKDSLAYWEQVYEPVSPELVNDAAKHQIYFSPEYQSLNIHSVELRRGGVWMNRLNPEKITLARRESEFESDMSDGMVSALIVLDDVRAGDVIRLAYTIRGSNPILRGMEHDEIYFGWGDPILDRRVRALYPPGTKISHKSFNGAPDVLIKNEADAVVVSAQNTQIAAMRDEGAYPRWYRPLPIVMFAPQRSWADVVHWAAPLYSNPVSLPNELELKIKAWQAIQNPEQRIMAVLQTMQEDIRYFGIEMGESSHRPSSPSDTWTRRYGDCKDKAYLMSVILTRLGIPAVPALTSTKLEKAIVENLPAATAFNHVIVQAQLGKQTLWLDPTITQQRGNAAEIDIANYGYVLPIDEGISQLREVVRTPNSKLQMNVQEKFRPSMDGKSIELLVTSEYLGGSADRMRREFVKRGREDMGRAYADYYRQRFGDLDIVAPLVVSDDQAVNKITIAEDYRLKQAWDEKTGNTKNLSIYADAMDQDTKLPGTMDRKSPIYLNSPMQYEYEHVLELPQGWTWMGSAEKQDVNTAWFNYQRSVQQNKNTVVIKQNIRFTKDYVSVDKLPDFFSNMRDVRNGMSGRFVLSAPSETQDKDRDERLKNILRDVMNNK
jgi:Domain of Unknown Function with PDB structure (DUF3857)/Transglutaminase-like superfamily